MKKTLFLFALLPLLFSCEKDDNQSVYIQKLSQEELESTGCWYHEYEDLIIKFDGGKIWYFADYKYANVYDYTMNGDTIIAKAWGDGELRDYKFTVDIVHWSFRDRQLRIIGEDIPYFLKSGYYDKLSYDIWD